MEVYTTKIQATVKGYSAWVIDQLVEFKRETQADVVKYLFDRWVDDHADWLENAYGLSRVKFELSQNPGAEVVDLNLETQPDQPPPQRRR